MTSKRTALILVAGAALFSNCIAPPAAAADAISADQVLKQDLEARGGKEAAAGIRSFHAQGTLTDAIVGTLPIDIFAARPDRFRFVPQWKQAPSGTFAYVPYSCYENGFDGRTAWEVLPGREPLVLDGILAEERRERATLFLWCPDVRDYRSCDYVGQTEFDGKRCHELRLITKSGATQTCYYDVSTHLLSGIVQSSAFGPSLEKLTFSDYRSFGGFLFPTCIRCRAEDGRDRSHVDSTWRFTSIELNSIADSAFERPGRATRSDGLVAVPSHGYADVEIQAMLRDWIDSDKVGVGLAVGLIDQRGPRAICYGSSGNPAAPDVNAQTLFGIASITKVFTRLLLLDMVERGDMKLDDPVQNYLPPSVKMPVRNGKEITLLHLATHTSGLPRDMVGGNSLADAYTFLSAYRLTRDPGEEYEYSNLGMALLGHVIALKAGRDYDTLVSERICRPLGMSSTHVFLTPQLRSRLAAGHDRPGAPRPYADPNCCPMPGAGWLRSSADDMLRLASVFVDPNARGLTMLMRHACMNHTGDSAGYESAMVFDPVRHRAVIMLSNTQSSPIDIVRWVLSRLIRVESPRPQAVAAVEPNVCEAYVGQYLLSDRSVWVVRRQGRRLLVGRPSDPSYELFPTSDTVFVNAMVGMRVTFSVAGKDRRPRLAIDSVDEPDESFHARGPMISAEVPIPGNVAVLDPNMASDCAGRYRDSAGNVIVIRYRWGLFTAEFVGQSLEDVVPESGNTFVSSASDAVLTFLCDDAGKVTGLIRHMYSTHTRFTKVAPSAVDVDDAGGEKLVGVWEGMLRVNPQVIMRGTITILSAPGSLNAAFDNLDTGTHFTFRMVSVEKQEVRMYTRSVAYCATLNDDSTAMTGTWKEGQLSLPITFKRTIKSIPERAK